MGLLRSLFGGGSAPARPAARSRGSELGFVRGRHFTEWTEEVKQLKRDGRQQDVINLCSEAIEAAEAEYKKDRLAIAPWWYEQVAMAARRSNQPEVERAAMQRYLDHPGRKNPEYVDKFNRLIAKLDKQEGAS